jgi:hypothetical protein
VVDLALTVFALIAILLLVNYIIRIMNASGTVDIKAKNKATAMKLAKLEIKNAVRGFTGVDVMAVNGNQLTIVQSFTTSR